MLKINSAYGDGLFHSKQLAIKSFEHKIKPENYTLLQKDKRYLVTTNRRASIFKKQGWKIIGRGTVEGTGFNIIKAPFRAIG